MTIKGTTNMARTKAAVKTESSDKAEKFSKIAKQRGAKVITAIRALGKTSRRGGYEYTEEQVENLFSVLQEELDKARAKFTFGDEDEAEETSEFFDF